MYDWYDYPVPVKAAERERQTASLPAKVYQVTGGRAIPPWKKFLSVNANKLSLQHFLTSYIMSHGPERLHGSHHKLYIAGGSMKGEEVKCITGDGVHDIPSLYSSQEDADTRMLLHAHHADQVFQANSTEGRIIIQSPDTDVLVLTVHNFPQLTHTTELWIQTGTITSTMDQRRYIPVHEICQSLSHVMHDILPAVHALTGCDTTSSFYGIGKRTVFKIVNNNPDEFASLPTPSKQ